MNNSPLAVFIGECQQRVDQAAHRWLPDAGLPPEKLHEAMRYAVINGGKRVRPTLVYAIGKALGIAPERLDGPACAIELIHAYSLVHDDLPSMDDDDLRRGQPTCHRQFDEATAILAGDALQTLAFHVLCKDESMQCSDSQRLEMVARLAIATGSRGMAGGQALDLASEGQALDLVQLENIHIHKTGALIRACAHLALIGAPETAAAEAKRLIHFAEYIGLAFQIQDDILDVEGDTEVLGKTGGKDADQGKATYPGLLGLTDARHKAQSLIEQAVSEISSFDDRADPLRWIARYIIDRNY